MWGLIPAATRSTIFVALVVYVGWLISEVANLVTGSPMSPFKSMGIVSSVIGTLPTILFSVAWRQLWRRFAFLNRWYPDLTGRWEGIYLSSYTHPDTGQRATGAMTLIIRQGLFDTTITAKTGEMQSHSTRSWLEADRNAQRFRMGYAYHSAPDALVRQRSMPHEGVCWLTSMPEEDPDHINGIYYTERRSIGDLDLRRVSRDVKATKARKVC
jgi:hypothetical protein